MICPGGIGMSELSADLVCSGSLDVCQAEVAAHEERRARRQEVRDCSDSPGLEGAGVRVNVCMICSDVVGILSMDSEQHVRCIARRDDGSTATMPDSELFSL